MRKSPAANEHDRTKYDPVIAERSAAAIRGMEEGTTMAVQMMRAGNLRLSPLPFERGQRPYDVKLRPIKATALIWKSWLREVLNRG